LVRERLKTAVVEHSKALEKEVKIEAELELWAPEFDEEEGGVGALSEDGNDANTIQETRAGSLSLPRWRSESPSDPDLTLSTELVSKDEGDSKTLSATLLHSPRRVHEYGDSDDDEPLGCCKRGEVRKSEVLDMHVGQGGVEGRVDQMEGGESSNESEGIRAERRTAKIVC